MAEANKSVDTSRPSRRSVKPPEERHKRGRWVLPVVLAVSVLLSLYFWY